MSIAIKLGDFEVLGLDVQGSNPSIPLHMAFVRYNGMIPSGGSSVLAFEIGRYDGKRDVQSGSPYYLPANEKRIDCRVDTYGRRVEMEILDTTPLVITTRNLTRTPTAVDDTR